MKYFILTVLVTIITHPVHGNMFDALNNITYCTPKLAINKCFKITDLMAKSTDVFLEDLSKCGTLVVDASSCLTPGNKKLVKAVITTIPKNVKTLIKTLTVTDLISSLKCYASSYKSMQSCVGKKGPLCELVGKGIHCAWDKIKKCQQKSVSIMDADLFNVVINDVNKRFCPKSKIDTVLAHKEPSSATSMQIPAILVISLNCIIYKFFL